MSKVPKVVVGAIAAALVVVGAIVVYRETDLLTASLVLLAGLMIAALLARRAAAREERAGMADWEAETRASAEAADDLFAGWSSTTPIGDGWVTTPDGFGNGSNGASGNGSGHLHDVTDPAAAFEAPEHTDEADRADEAEAPGADDAVEPFEPTADDAPLWDGPAAPAPSPAAFDTAESSEAPDGPPAARWSDDPEHPGQAQDRWSVLATPEPAFASAGAGRASPIDWTGQGGRVNEQVRGSDDILRASEATALPAEGSVAGGSELARLLAKVEARLRDYE
jgi:hypothetical protein